MLITGAGLREIAAGIGVGAAVVVLGSSMALAQPDDSGPDLELFRPEAIGTIGVVSDGGPAITIDARLQPLLQELLAHSTTFRRQWLRLTRAARLTVRVELVHQQHVLEGLAATRLEVGPDGSRQATVALPGGTRLAERLAHEVEHIIEALDGIKVATRHALGDGSVRRGSGTFETARAVLVGQMVAGEFRPR